MPGQRGSAAAGEQREPVVEAVGQLGRGQRAQPRHRQLDRQRHAVEGPADLGDRRGVAGVELEVGQHRGGPVGEQPHGRKRMRIGSAPGPVARSRVGGRVGTGGTGSGATTCRLSPPIRSGSRLVASTWTPGQSASSRAARRAAASITCSQLSRISSASRSARAAQSRSAGSAPPSPPRRAIDRSRRPTASRTACGTSDGSVTGASSTNQAERSGPGVIGPGQALGRLGREPGLAHAARPGQRDQALGGELLEQAGHLGVAADEAGGLTPAG